MRRMDRGFKDRFPRLPPGVTPSDIDRAVGADHPEEADCVDCGTTVQWEDFPDEPPVRCPDCRGEDGG